MATCPEHIGHFLEVSDIGAESLPDYIHIHVQERGARLHDIVRMEASRAQMGLGGVLQSLFRKADNGRIGWEIFHE